MPSKIVTGLFEHKADLCKCRELLQQAGFNPAVSSVVGAHDDGGLRKITAQLIHRSPEHFMMLFAMVGAVLGTMFALIAMNDRPQNSLLVDLGPLLAPFVGAIMGIVSGVLTGVLAGQSAAHYVGRTDEDRLTMAKWLLSVPIITTAERFAVVNLMETSNARQISITRAKAAGNLTPSSA